jgi:hypothetical protein
MLASRTCTEGPPWGRAAPAQASAEDLSDLIVFDKRSRSAPRQRGGRTNDQDGGEDFGGLLDLRAGGREDGPVAITEGDLAPRSCCAIMVGRILLGW